MKRVFALLIILLLFVYSSSFASENPYLGIWVFERPAGLNSKTIITYQVDEKDRVFYSRQEFFFDGSPAVIDSKVFSCEYDDKKITIKDGDFTFKELYYVDPVRLSADKRKTYNFYHRVLESTAEYEDALALSNLKKINLDPCGKWSYYNGTTDLNNVILLDDTGVLSFELFFYTDGSVYLSEAYMKKNYTNLFFEDLTGIWIGDHNDMTFMISNKAYKAWISDDGILHVRFPSGYVFTFIRVDGCEAVK